MKKAVLFSLVIFVLAGVTAVILRNIDWLINIPFVAGMLFLAMAIITSGSLGSGYQVRTINYSESRADRQERHERENTLLIIGLINLLGSISIYLLLS